MGSWISSIVRAEAGAEAGLGDLPESCIAEVLLRLDAQEICRASGLNRAFRVAASADFVWEAKLPKNYVYLMEMTTDRTAMACVCKKEIYERLCRPNPFDGGTKEFWLEKNRGGICMSISSKALLITGINDKRYWKYLPTEESRFNTVAYLQQTWWFEVAGEIDFFFPVGTYSMFFQLHLGLPSKRFGRRICNSEHIHGWDKKPVKFQLWTSNGQKALSQCSLSDPGSWINYHVGDFVVDKCDVPTKLKFSLTQIDCTHTKGGICVDSVFICPKCFM
ncbi:F-box protein PP2-A13-like [Zingiber officinale]|nr:F-box protein PP2-A13-like [Zingiber officinale]